MQADVRPCDCYTESYVCPCESIEVPYADFITPATPRHDGQVCNNKTNQFTLTEFGYVRSAMIIQHIRFHDVHVYVLEFCDLCMCMYMYLKVVVSANTCAIVGVFIHRMGYCLNVMQAFTQLHSKGSMASPILLSATIAFDTSRTALRGKFTAHRSIPSHLHVLLHTSSLHQFLVLCRPACLQLVLGNHFVLADGLSEAYLVLFEHAGVTNSLLSGSQATQDLMRFSGLLDQGSNTNATSAVVVSPLRR